MLHLQDGDEIRDVAVEIFAPTPADEKGSSTWKCEYRITGLSKTIDRQAYGVDGVQALILALEIIGVDLNFSDERKANLLYWFEPNDDLGFRVTESVNEGLSERADLELAKRMPVKCIQ